MMYPHDTPYSLIANLRKSISHTGLKETPFTKRLKSRSVIAISDDNVIISDSGKLLGDYLHRSKDYIKNCLRQPSIVEGFHVFYNDYEKRQDIRKKMYEKRSIRSHDYMTKLELLDKCEFESVETIYAMLSSDNRKVYKLIYENVDEKGDAHLEEISMSDISECVGKTCVAAHA